MSDHCDFHQLLVRHHLRPTTLRLAVLEALGSAPRAWRAREIMAEVRTRRQVNKVTIYRILDHFTQLGLIRKLSLEGKSSHYELACEHRPPHPHFQCYSCGGVQCLEPVSLEGLWRELRGPLGNRADRVEIRVAGVCQDCRGVG